MNLKPPSLPRNRRKWPYLLAAVVIIILLGVLLYAQLTPTNSKLTDCSLHKIGTISLPNTSGRIDHIAYNPASSILAIAARNNNSLAIANISSMSLVKTINRFSLPQWTAFVDQGKALAVTNGGNGTVSVLDSRDFTSLANVNLLSGADNMVVDSASSLLYVGYGSGGVAIINTTSWKILKQIPITGHPEAMRLEEAGSKLFVNVPAGNYVAVLDKTTGQLIANWPVTNATGLYPMALDEYHHALFVGSRSPDKIIMINATSGTEITEMSIPGDADDMFYDANNGCVFVSSGTGQITVVKEVNASSLKIEQSLQTYLGARTSFLDAGSGFYFLAVPASQNTSAMVVVYNIGI